MQDPVSPGPAPIASGLTATGYTGGRSPCCFNCGKLGTFPRYWKGTCDGSISISAAFCEDCGDDLAFEGWSRKA